MIIICDKNFSKEFRLETINIDNDENKPIWRAYLYEIRNFSYTVLHHVSTDYIIVVKNLIVMGSFVESISSIIRAALVEISTLKCNTPTYLSEFRDVRITNQIDLIYKRDQRVFYDLLNNYVSVFEEGEENVLITFSQELNDMYIDYHLSGMTHGY